MRTVRVVAADFVPASSPAVPPAPTWRPRRRQDRPWLRRAIAFIACVLLADALFGDWGLAETLRARRDYGQGAAELSALRRENAALRDEAKRLESDPRTIEAVAREDLGLVRPGEILVVVTDRR